NTTLHSSVEYPGPGTKKTGKTEQALLTNYKPEPHIRSGSSEPTTLATPLNIYCTSFVSFSGWLPIFLQRDRGSAEANVVQYASALIRRYTSTPRLDEFSLPRIGRFNIVSKTHINFHK
uniref:Ovule protein n=1 Tax=Mesocestoides corti TaxID=53468 RepID=A0A5K3FUA3_MESCO